MCIGCSPDSVNARTKELVQHVVFIGGDNQPINGKTHHSGDMPCTNIAEIAAGNGETH